MKKIKQDLKITSIVVLVLAACTLVNMVAELVWGDINRAVIPNDAPENILQITKIFLVVLTVLLILPQIYIGIKGLKIARKPDSSKGHIVWAIILFVFAIIGLISPVSGIISTGKVMDYLGAIFSFLLEIAIYFEYIVYAKAISKAN